MAFLFLVFLTFTIALWWTWPVSALVRKIRSGRMPHWSVSVMLQLTGVSGILGGLFYGISGVIGGVLFPPIWPFSTSFFLHKAEIAALPTSQFFTVSILAAAVSAAALITIAKIWQTSALHSVVLVPFCIATLSGLWAMDMTAQQLISDRATELGVTCLNSKPIWDSIRDAGSGYPGRHATARQGNDILYWSYRQQDFNVDFTLRTPRPATWCPSR